MGSNGVLKKYAFQTCSDIEHIKRGRERRLYVERKQKIQYGMDS
jgi:hypothetical protein